MREYLLECSEIGYRVGDDVILNSIDFTLSPGQGIIIFSESNQAGTSLLQICSTLIRPTTGKLFIQGKEVDYEDQKGLSNFKRRLAFVDSQSTLIQNMTVFENIALSTVYHENKSGKGLDILLDPVIEMFNLRHTLSLRPAELDSATRSRALYAIEVLKEPAVALFDRPDNDFSRNDRHYLLTILEALKEGKKGGYIVCTKSESLIEQCGDTIIVLKDGLIKAQTKAHSFLSSLR